MTTASGSLNRSKSRFSVHHTDAEWRATLPPAAYHVLRQHGTERAGTSPLDAERRPGRYMCAACQNVLFGSDAKFDSDTGWPSFTVPLPNAVGTKTDRTLVVARTEFHCSQCGGHLGHVFEDGPAPTGHRYCANGVAMRFVPA